MKTKRISFTTHDEEYHMSQIKPEDNIEKIASGEISDKIRSYIEEHIREDPDHIFVLLAAVGAGEIWGSNINADYFPEDEIIDHYDTFENFAYAFKHHKNKDPKNSIGEILLSHWNEKMHRVELIVKLDRDKAPKICSDIDNGKMWDVSMGCKVPYDVCSICGNKAHTQTDYCTHIKNHKNEILPDGRRVYMINVEPKFFDISFVRIGADRTAKTLKKIASRENMEYNIKKGNLEKEVPGDTLSTDAAEIAVRVMKEFNRIKEIEKPFPKESLEAIAEFDLPDILTTLFSLGIKLKPKEFLYIVCRKMNEKPERIGIINSIPDEVTERIKSFSPFRGDIKTGIISHSVGFMPERSSFRPYLYPRIIKKAGKGREPRFSPDVAATPGLIVGSALYKKYLDQVPMHTAEGLDAKMKENPWLLPLATAGSIGVLRGIGSKRKAQERWREKTSNLNKLSANLGGRIFAGVPAAHLASEIAKRSNSRSKLVDFISKHPNLVALLGIGATNTKDDWQAIKAAIDSMQGVKTASIKTQLSPGLFFDDIDMNELTKVANYVKNNECDLGIPKQTDYSEENTLMALKLF